MQVLYPIKKNRLPSHSLTHWVEMHTHTAAKPHTSPRTWYVSASLLSLLCIFMTSDSGATWLGVDIAQRRISSPTCCVCFRSVCVSKQNERDEKQNKLENRVSHNSRSVVIGRGHRPPQDDFLTSRFGHVGVHVRVCT